MKPLLFALLLSSSIPLHAEETRPRIEVTGTASKKIANDAATIQIGIENKAATKKEAEEKTKTSLATLMQWLKKFEGASTSATTSLSIYPIYNQNNGLPAQDRKLPKVIGYNASAMISCEIGASTAGDFIAQATENGATSVGGISFHLKESTITKSENDLLSDAFNNAKEKAAILSKTAEKKLGGALHIQTTQNNENNPIRPMMARAFAASAPPSDETTPYEMMAGESSLNSTVTVEFELLP